MFIRFLPGFALTLAVACDPAGTDTAVDECGPSHPCADGFTCSSEGRCIRSGQGSIDAPPADAGAALLDTTLLTSPPARAASASARFTFSGIGATSFLCKLDDRPATPCTSPFEITVSEGAHAFSVAAVGADGADPTPAVVAWTVDLTPPDTMLTGPSGTVATTDATFVITANEEATFECALDANVFPCTSPAHFSGLARGEHHLAARAIDLAGNVDPSPAQAIWTVDVTGPIIVIDGSPADLSLTNNPHAHFTLSFVDPADADGGTFACAIDGGAAAPCTSPVDVTFAGDGPHVFGARGHDRAGNTGPLVRRSFMLDTTPPVATLSGPPDDGSVTASQSTSFTWSLDAGAGPGAVVECLLEGPGGTEAFAPAGCRNRTGLADGPYRFSARGRDAAGNVGAAAAIAWTVITVGPAVVWLPSSTPANGAATTSPDFAYAWTFADPADAASGRLEYSLDGTAWVASPTGTLAGSFPAADGTYVFFARGVDARGTPGPLIFREFFVDTHAPVVLLGGSPANNGFTNTATALVWTFDPAEPRTSTFECAIDDDPSFSPSACANRSYPDGGHSFAVRGRDAAGNVGAAARIAFTVDTVAPIVTIDGENPPDGSTSATPSWSVAFHVSESETFVNIDCLLDGQSQPCNPRSIGVTGAGLHTLKIRAIDFAGNVGPYTNQVSFTLDNFAPTLENIVKPRTHNGPRSFTVTWTASEPATYQCTFININNPIDCANGVATGTEVFGQNLLNVIATDPFGNWSSTAIVWVVN